MFKNSQESHTHSLETLNLLFEHDDFMESIESMVDIGCGEGLDLEWWATRTTRDDDATPLNIKCTGVDLNNKLSLTKKYPNVNYQKSDFENKIELINNKKYDLLWCHDTFQYALNPIQTLSRWWEIANDNAMLVLVLPQTTNLAGRRYDFSQPSGCYYHHTIVSLIHMLSVSGWDCAGGFFLKRPTDNWLHAVVYKSDHKPLDPKTTTWYHLLETGLLPKSAQESVLKHGYLRQQDLIVPWLNKSLMHLGNQ